MITKEDIEEVASTPMEMVREYHETSGQPLDAPREEELLGLRMRLLAEEADEAGMPAQFSEEILKELADVLYVTYGFAATFGWDLEEAFRRVHKNNMERMFQDDGTIHYRGDGKIIKNPSTPSVYLGDLV